MPIVWVSVEDFDKAITRFEKLVPIQTSVTWALGNFLGVRHLPKYNSLTGAWGFSEDAARKIELLLGPHYVAIIKAYEAKQEQS